ncbi:hypothetical protein DF3PB_700011 [uncultured Defluviicoccus sp.]|uniref:Uncharacterized protein n=1 Tax=metagenome TaxID=256318 RepID=A0A380TLB4_9ZZZZ|nr:hypothetical protein DF3PB_700011 [uncultured Defluviicoccus sp.]
MLAVISSLWGIGRKAAFLRANAAASEAYSITALEASCPSWSVMPSPPQQTGANLTDP